MIHRTGTKLALLAVMLTGVHLALANGLGSDDAVVNFMWAEVPIYLAAVFVVLRDKDKNGWRVVTLILVTGAILRGMVLTIDPVSTDINRYIWDGRVQAAGINPYLYVPADPALKDLRDSDIYPDINRKDYAPTIYPPMAQIIFFLVTRYDEDITVMKAAMAGFEIIAILALMLLLKARNIPPARILLYVWHPVPIWEFAGDGHVDAIAIACVCLSLLAAEKRRPVLAGIALGGATLTKFFPILIGPALYRRWDWKLPLAGLATIVLLYLPYLGAGKKLLGFLNGYSAEEGFNDGSGLYPWLVLKHLWPGLPQGAFAFYMPLLALLLAATGLVSLFRHRDKGLDLGGAFLLATLFTVLTSPHYIWYLAWLVPFLCFYPSLAVLWLTCAATFMNNLGWPPNFTGGSIVFLPFFAFGAFEIVRYGLRMKKERDREYGAAEAGPSTPVL